MRRSLSKIKETDKEDLKEPIPLEVGTTKVEVREQGAAPISYAFTVPSDDKQPNYLVWRDGHLRQKRLHRLVSLWMLEHGGKVKLVGYAEWMDKVEELPDDKLELEQLDLTDVHKVPPAEIDRICHVETLKRLVAPKSGLAEPQRAELRAALPDLKIEQPAGAGG
jgi:hypothetical protein